MATIPELPTAPSRDDPLGLATPEARYADALGAWMVKSGKVKMADAPPVPEPVPVVLPDPTPAPADPLPPTRSEAIREATRAKRRQRVR